jgi:5-methylcytosine-specific restriction endonuclease McrA
VSKFPKPCLDCGRLTTGGNRCVVHQQRVEDLHEAKRAQIKKATGQYSGDYRKRAAQVRATALVCHLCGDGFRLSDPWVADHVDASSHGDIAELRAAHRSCNAKRGNKPL